MIDIRTWFIYSMSKMKSGLFKKILLSLSERYTFTKKHNKESFFWVCTFTCIFVVNLLISLFSWGYAVSEGIFNCVILSIVIDWYYRIALCNYQQEKLGVMGGIKVHDKSEQ